MPIDSFEVFDQTNADKMTHYGRDEVSKVLSEQQNL